MKGVKVEKPLLRVPAKIGRIASDSKRSVRRMIHLGQSPASDQRMIACASVTIFPGKGWGASFTGRMVTPGDLRSRGRPEWRNLEKDCGQEPEWRTPA